MEDSNLLYCFLQQGLNVQMAGTLRGKI